MKSEPVTVDNPSVMTVLQTLIEQRSASTVMIRPAILGTAGLIIVCIYKPIVPVLVRVLADCLQSERSIAPGAVFKYENSEDMDFIFQWMEANSIESAFSEQTTYIPPIGRDLYSALIMFSGEDRTRRAVRLLLASGVPIAIPTDFKL